MPLFSLKHSNLCVRGDYARQAPALYNHHGMRALPTLFLFRVVGAAPGRSQQLPLSGSVAPLPSGRHHPLLSSTQSRTPALYSRRPPPPIPPVFLILLLTCSLFLFSAGKLLLHVSRYQTFPALLPISKCETM